MCGQEPHTGVAECAFHLDECPIPEIGPFLTTLRTETQASIFLAKLSAVRAEVKCDHSTPTYLSDDDT